MSFPSFSVGEVLTAADMNAVGLWKVKSQAVGTTAVSSVNVTSCFSSDYDVYVVQLSGVTFSAVSLINCRLLSGTTEAQTSYNFAIPAVDYAANNFLYDRAQNGTVCRIGRSNRAGGKMSFSIEVAQPFLAEYTIFSNIGRWDDSTGYAGNGVGIHQATTSYDGIQIRADSGTMTNGTIQIYGYRK
jgi:hypothetical protein